MVRYLVLHTNGTYTAYDKKGSLELKDIRAHLNGGYMSNVPTDYAGDDDGDGPVLRHGSTLIADEEGLMKRLPQNAWSFAMAALGYKVCWSVGGLCGPLILAPRNNNKAGDMTGSLSKDFDTYLDAIKKADDEEGSDNVLENVLAQVEKEGILITTAPQKKSKKRPREEEEEEKEDEKKKKKKKKTLNPEEKSSVPKEPHVMKQVHTEIMRHPDYPRIKSTVRWCFEAGCVGGFSFCTKENNSWSREIWRYLHRSTPMKDGKSLFEEESKKE